MMRLKFFDCTEGHKPAPVVPVVATTESACADFKACFHKPVFCVNVDNEKDNINADMVIDIIDGCVLKMGFTVEPGMRACIPTGFRCIIPHGWQMKLVPRSGLALKYGITLINSPGTIDSDYTDEIMAIIHNTSNKPYTIYEGDRICQYEMVWNNMPRLHSEQIYNEEMLNEHKLTSNRNGGLGHTGK